MAAADYYEDSSSESSDPDRGAGPGRRRKRVPQSRDFTVVEDISIPTSVLSRVGSLVRQSRPASRSISAAMNPKMALKHLIMSKRRVDDRTVDDVMSKITTLDGNFVKGAIIFGKLNILKKIIEKFGYEFAQASVRYGLGLEAAQYRQLDILKWILDVYGDEKFDPQMGLMFATNNGDFEMVRYLVETRGADINEFSGIGTPLGAALRSENREIIEYMTNLGGNTTLINAFKFKDAVSAGDLETVIRIANLSYFMTTDILGNINRAAKLDHFEVLKFLLNEFESQIIGEGKHLVSIYLDMDIIKEGANRSCKYLYNWLVERRLGRF
jgi:hypothetical protein